MAKKAKRGRPRGSSKKQKDEKKATSSFWRGFAAVVLIIAGIVLLFGAFINAPLPKNVWNGVWVALGAATVLAPITLVYLGGLKFLSEDQRIPFAKILGVAALLTFLASLAHVMFIHTDAATGLPAGGYGGAVGKAIGNPLQQGLGTFLSSLIFFILTIFAGMFTFGIEPKVLLKLANLFKKEAGEAQETESEDLAELKKKAAGFSAA